MKPTKPTQEYQASRRKLQLQVAISAAFLYLLAAFAAGVATAATNTPSVVGGANGPSRHVPRPATASQSRAASRFASLNANKTNAPSTVAGSARRPANQRIVLDDVGPNHRGWKSEADFSAVAVSNRFALARGSVKPQVVEIATGMNYWDGQHWSLSDASFDLTEDSFVANRVQHRTRLNANLNVIGAVTTTLVDGTTLRSTPVAIALYDPNDGRFGVVSTITNSVGVLVASNQVVYPDAFSGGLCANVVYTLQAGSFEQDVVITGRLNPLDYGFPTNAQIQVITEFYDPPQPEKMRRPIYVEQKESVRRRKVSPDLVDDLLGFSDLVIGTGRAFTPSTATHTNGTQTVVAKEFRTIPEEGRTFLIETVNCLSIQEALNALPKCGEARTAQQIHNRADGYALVPRPSQITQAKAKPQKSPNQLAQANTPARSGVVIDYIATLSGNLSGTIIFKGDTTYFVSGTVYCNGPVTLEAAVFKHKVGTSIVLNNTLTCKTSSYRPAVCTCIDDDSIGESLAGYPGYTGTINPAGYGNPALCSQWSSTPSLSNVRFCYAQEALRLVGTYVSATLSHAQIIKCIRGIVLVSAASGSCSGSGPCDFSITVNNALLSFVNYALIKSTDYGSGSGSGPVAYAYLYNCTVNHSQVLANEDHVYPYFPVTFKNSILADIGSLGNASLANSTYNGFYSDPPNSPPLFGNPASRWTSSTDPFQMWWGGAYYLKADSSFRGKGATTGLPTALLPSLKSKATQPPMAFPRFTEVSGELTLFPQVPRYVSGPPDLGYWYDALDYTVASMWLEGGSITVQPGTAVGFRNEYAPDFFWPWYWTLEGIELWEGSSFISHGMPTRPIVFADIQNVQEQAGLATAAFFVPAFILDANNTPPPVVDFRFSNFYAAPGASPGYIYLSYFQDPAFYASPGSFHFWSGPDELGDCLYSFNSTVNLTLRDCSLQGGAVNLGKNVDFVMNLPCNVSWINSLFDRVDFNLDPDWVDQADPTLYVDLAFQGYNNLFRGGLFRMVPISATAGNWIFRDNLFDKIAFEQDTTVALDHDYNGYWKRLSGEKETWQTDRLTPNAANDKVLTSAPYYQPGPLGSYYLPASGLLYNGGSRTPGDAGLYHYTTRIDQTKDGVESPNVVNIGLHYVATANYSSTQPKDTDSDGIPDFVEDANGNGVVDTLETNPNANDATLDPDGDHLTNLQEYILATNPFIADTDSDGINDGDEDFDGDGISNWAEFQQGSDPVNRMPFATPQSLSVARNFPQIVTLTGWDWENDPLTYSVWSQPAHGSLSGTAPSLVYSPQSGFTGWDSFSFKVNDGHGNSAPAAVHLQVKAPDPIPVANPQSLSVVGMPINITLTGSSGGGGGLTFTVVNGPFHGALMGSPPNLTYTPDLGYQSGDYFTFKVINGNADSAPAMVSISHNAAPVVTAGPDMMAHLSDTTTLHGFAADDGVPGASVSVTWTKVGGPGTVTFGDDSSFKTTANFSSAGTYTLRLTADDSQLSSADDAVITVRPDSELIIATQPWDQATELGGNAMFAVQGSGGGGTVTFEWHHGGVVVGTDNWLEIDPVEAADAGEYNVMVSDGTTTFTSRTALLTLTDNCIPAPDGLIAWWRSENTGLDNSGLHNATLAGVSFSSGRVGQAFNFDSASDRATTADHTQFAFTESFAVEGWVYVNAFSHGFIFVRGNNQPGVYPYYLSVEPSGVLRFYISSGTSSDQLETSLIQGQWHHVAAVLDDSSSQMLLYIDGANAANKTTSVRPFATLSGAALGIGNHPFTGETAAFNGMIDELAVYSSALSAFRVGLLYNASAGKCLVRLPGVPAVQFTPSDNRPIPTSATLSVPGFSGAEIYYTLDGKIPTRSRGILYTSPIPLSQPTTIIAFATMQASENGPTTIQKFGNPADTIRVLGHNQVAIPNEQLLLPFVANITTSSGRPVPDGELVTFTARSPSGADITANLSYNSDITGSLGYPGLVRTFLTLGSETGVYTVVANYGGQQITFDAETVTPVLATGTDKNYLPTPGIEDPSGVLVSVSGQRQNLTHALGADLSGGQGQATVLEETAPGSGQFTPVPPIPPFVAVTGDETKYASADYKKNDLSYWDDSEEFELRFRQADLSIWGFFDPKVSRGSARSPYYPSYDLDGPYPVSLGPADWIHVTKDFLKAAGYRTLQTTVLGLFSQPLYQFIPDQADVFYISTHGLHASGTILTEGRKNFGAEDTDWHKGLDIVVIAGCSVLDVTGTKWVGDPDPNQQNIAPGRKWADTGPCLLLGYEHSAPPDRFLHWSIPPSSDAGPKQVVNNWVERMETYWESPAYAWIYANWSHQNSVHKNCHNATAIDACSSPRKAYHLIGNLPGSFFSNFEMLEEDQWAGQE